MNSHAPQLIPQTDQDDSGTAFDGDKLNRDEIAEQLTGYIGRLGRGSVIAIDAPWGEGKTWFARHWNKSLNKKGFKTLYIDAFKQDYIEDPFILISAEFSKLLDDNQSEKEKFVGNAAKIGKALLPTAGKIAVNVIGNFVGVSGLSEKLIDSTKDPLADLLETTIESRIKEYDANKAAMEEFKKEVSQFAASEKNPIVILIDELDRCRPTFGINLIERIKHFFDVPNIVFVLFVNRSQLDRSIEVLYGKQPEGATYLNKFINMQFSLPKALSSDYMLRGHYGKYIESEISKYKYNSEAIGELAYFLGIMAIIFDLSLRDIERSCNYIALAPNASKSFVCYLSAIKAKHAELIPSLKQDEPSAHNKCIELINDGLIRSKKNLDLGRIKVIQSIAKFHKEAMGQLYGNDSITPEDKACLGNTLIFTRYENKEIISSIAQKIDLINAI